MARGFAKTATGGSKRSSTLKEKEFLDSVMNDAKMQEGMNETLEEAKKILSSKNQQQETMQETMQEAWQQQSQNMQAQQQVYVAQQQQASQALNNVVAQPVNNPEQAIEDDKETQQEINEQRQEQVQELGQEKADAIAAENDRYQTKKDEAKREYEEKLAKIKEGPPGFMKFFSSSASYWFFAIADSVVALVPSFVGTLLSPIVSGIAFIYYMIGAIITGSIGAFFAIIFLYSIDILFSSVASLIASFVPVVGDAAEAILDFIPEIMFSWLGLAPYQMIDKSIDNYQSNRVRKAEEKYQKSAGFLQKKHNKILDRIKTKFSNEKKSLLASFRYAGERMSEAGEKWSFTVVMIVTVFLTLTGVIGIPYPEFSMSKVFLTVIFFVLLFFLQKTGLLPNE